MSLFYYPLSGITLFIFLLSIIFIHRSDNEAKISAIMWKNLLVMTLESGTGIPIDITCEALKGANARNAHVFFFSSLYTGRYGICKRHLKLMARLQFLSLSWNCFDISILWSCVTFISLESLFTCCRFVFRKICIFFYIFKQINI